MSSVTRFLKQISPQQESYIAPGTLTTLAANAYEFVPTSANYVGNYPPGAMVAASVTGLNGAIANAAVNAGVPTANAVCVLRDMGKTVFAPTNASVSGAQTATSNSATFGYYRQVQLLVPKPITSFVGSNVGTFGVAGPSVDAYTPYMTFYIPTVVAGILGGAQNAGALLTPSVGGGM